VIPKDEYHRFTNASSTDSMSLEAWYDPAGLARERKSFQEFMWVYCRSRLWKGRHVGKYEYPPVSAFAWEADAMLCAPSELTSSAYATVSLLATLITSFSGCVSCPYDHWSTNFLCVDMVFGPFSGEVDDGIPRKL
jgi:hypothetical protein